MAARSQGSVSIRSVAAACTLMVSATMPARSCRLLSFFWSICRQPGTNRLRKLSSRARPLRWPDSRRVAAELEGSRLRGRFARGAPAAQTGGAPSQGDEAGQCHGGGASLAGGVNLRAGVVVGGAY